MPSAGNGYHHWYGRPAHSIVSRGAAIHTADKWRLPNHAKEFRIDLRNRCTEIRGWASLIDFTVQTEARFFQAARYHEPPAVRMT